MKFYMGGAHNEEFEGGRIIREKPPRYLSRYTQAVIYFGGTIQQAGWAFFGFGMIFFWVFVMNSEAKYLLTFDGTWEPTTGTITNISRTNSEVNDRVIFAYSFKYTVGAKELETTSYDYYDPSIQLGDQLPVEYKSKDNDRARIKGMTNSMFPVWVIFVSIFPLLGLVFVLVGVFRNRKALDLIINGIFTKGKMVDKRQTNTRINNRYVYRYIFEFEADGKRFETTCRTHQSWRVEDEAMEIILYEAQNPSHAIIYDAVPSVPQINPMGELEPATPSAGLVFILPSIALGLNMFLFYLFVILDIM